MSYDSFSILSVDWDYFFPNLHHFDWGFNEKLSVFFEAIWELRAYQDLYSASNGIVKDKESRIIDYAVPRVDEVKSFWDTVCPVPPLGLVIAETHESLYEMADFWPSGSIWNFDAHHDLGYDKGEDGNCGNWAKRLFDEGYFDQSEYRIIYPKWRKKDPERTPYEVPENVVIKYGMPKRLPYFRYVFICRSSVWTPSWCDDLWMEFIEYWEYTSLWTTKSHAPFAVKPRSFNMDNAESCRKQIDEAKAQMCGGPNG
jgi:hypothetical protein